MPQIIPLDSIPNQNLSIQLADNRYDLSIKSTKTSTIMTITRNETLLINNVRCVGGSPIIPYDYLRGEFGNFIFETQNEEIPYYTNFGITQFLVFASLSEIEAAIAEAESSA